MWTSVPQMEVARTSTRTSVPAGSGTFTWASSAPGAAVAFTTAVIESICLSYAAIPKIPLADQGPDPSGGRSRLGCGACRAEGGDEHASEHIYRSVSERAQEPTPGSA